MIQAQQESSEWESIDRAICGPSENFGFHLKE